MSEYFKGFVVHLEKDIKDEHSVEIQTALRMIKGVRCIEVLTSEFDDQIAYMRGNSEAIVKMGEFLISLSLAELKGEN